MPVMPVAPKNVLITMRVYFSMRQCNIKILTIVVKQKQHCSVKLFVVLDSQLYNRYEQLNKHDKY